MAQFTEPPRGEWEWAKLARHQLPHLAESDPITGKPLRASRRAGDRYEHERPGDTARRERRHLRRLPPPRPDLVHRPRHHRPTHPLRQRQGLPHRPPLGHHRKARRNRNREPRAIRPGGPPRDRPGTARDRDHGDDPHALRHTSSGEKDVLLPAFIHSGADLADLLEGTHHLLAERRASADPARPQRVVRPPAQCVLLRHTYDGQRPVRPDSTAKQLR